MIATAESLRSEARVHGSMCIYFLCYCQTERDTVEVIAYLKKEDGQKDQEIDSLRQQVKDIRVTAHNERDVLIAEHEKKVTELEDALNEKNEEVCAVYHIRVFN